MVICFVCNEIPPAPAGGIGPCVRTTAIALAELGHEVHIVGVYDRAFDWHIPGVTMHPIGVSNRSYTRALMARGAIRRAISRIHRNRKVDVVEWPDYEGLFLTNVHGTVDVVRNHGPALSHTLAGLDGGQRSPVTTGPISPGIRHARRSRFRLAAASVIQQYAELRTLRVVPNWIGVSQWFFDEWVSIAGVQPRRSTIIYNPVDCDLFRPDESPARDQNLILYAGSLIERKGVYALAAGARIFLKKLPSAHLMYVGREAHGPARARILQHIDAEERDRVIFRDALPQTELASLMRRCALFAMPSILESFGNVWAEAMASGAPVLGSTLSAGPEIVPNGVAGMLVNPAEPEEIARATVSLMSNHTLRGELGARGRSIAVARYSLSTGIQRTIEFYQRCCSTGKPVMQSSTIEQ